MPMTTDETQKSASDYAVVCTDDFVSAVCTRVDSYIAAKRQKKRAREDILNIADEPVTSTNTASTQERSNRSVPSSAQTNRTSTSAVLYEDDDIVLFLMVRFANDICKELVGNAMVTQTALAEFFRRRSAQATSMADVARACDTLCTAGLLLPAERVGSFYFCVPGGAAFLTALLKGRSEMLQMLKRKKYNEILLSDLPGCVLRCVCVCVCVGVCVCVCVCACVCVWKALIGVSFKAHLRTSKLPVMFIAKDLIGNDLLLTVETTAGTLLRLNRK
jgi:hypothetical protein